MSTELQSTACPQHPEVTASYVCGRCQTAVCGDCCYTMPDGSVCCKTCYHAEPLTPSVPAPAAESRPPPLRVVINKPVGTPAAYLPTRHIGEPCVQHPHVMAVARCQNCGAASCRTCDFVFPVNLHFCPVCVAEGTSKLSPRRKRYMITAYVLAIWSSLGMLVLVSGAAAGLASDPVGRILVGFGVILIVGLPAIIGTAMGMSAKRPGGPNPISVWIALTWNALILGGFILLIVIGNLRS